MTYLDSDAQAVIADIDHLRSRRGDMGLTAEALAWVQDLEGVRKE